MPVATRLGPAELAEFVRSSARVVEDHAPALDLLASVPDDLPIPGTDPSIDGPGATEPEAVPLDGRPSSASSVASPGVGTQLAVSLGDVASRLDGASDLAAAADVLEATRPAGGHGGFDAVVQALGTALRNADSVDAARVAIGLELAAEALAPADDGSHPGGFAAVVAATAAGALGSLDRGGSLLDVLVAAADDGLEELERGPVLDPELAERGAVDAGAAGYLLFVDTAAAWVAGDPLPSPPAEPAGWTAPMPGGARRFVVACSVEPRGENHLEASDWLESVWHELGDLVRFERSAAHWDVEVATSLPGAAIEALCEIGRPRDLRIDLAPDGPTGDHVTS